MIEKEYKKIIDRWIYSQKLVHIRTRDKDYRSMSDQEIEVELFKISQEKLIPFNVFSNKENKNLVCVAALEDGFIYFNRPSEFKAYIKSGQCLIFLTEIPHKIDFLNKTFLFTYEPKDHYVY